MTAWSMLLLTVVAQCVVLAGMSSAGASEDSVKTVPAVASSSDAMNQALKYTGFGKLSPAAKATSQKAELVVVAGDSTPFLAERMNGHEAWRVTFDSVGLQDEGAADPHKVIYRNYDVFIDPSTGYLMKVVSRLPGQHDDVFPEPSLESAEIQLRRCSEGYHEYAPDSGLVSFADVAQTRPGVLAAKEIKAVCIMYTWGAPPIGHDVPRPFWIIALRGGIPLLFHGPGADSVPLSYRTSYREIIDAKSGRPISRTNLPIFKEDTLRER